MKARAKIKVIKKGTLKSAEKPAVSRKHRKKEAGHEIAATLMNWVSEFQNRKRKETRHARENFQLILAPQKG